MLENANALKEQFLEKVNSAASSNELEQLRIEFLGKKGPITSLMSELRNIPNEQKKEAGQIINEVKQFIEKTLTENGHVSRGVCETNDQNLLTSVVERTKIQRFDGVVKYQDENDEWVAISDNTPVSMNFWGFTPDYFQHSVEYFKEFLSDPKNMENLKSEFFIPLMVDKLINDGTATCEVLDTTSQWFGVTYPEDRPEVVARFAKLGEDGVYPANMF